MRIVPFSTVLATACLVLLGTACAPSARGGADAAGMITPAMLEPPPVYALLGFRSDLALTSEQIAVLDSIAEAARAEITPMIRELEEGADRGRGGVLRVDADDPLLDEIRSARQNISAAVERVLSAEQQATVCRLFERRGPGNQQQRTGGNRSPQAARVPDAGRGAPLMSTWSWCGPAPSEEEA